MSRPLTVDAVIMREGKVLLVRRRHGPCRGCHALPGGYVDRGEDIKDALVREVREETGLRVKPGRMIGIYDDPGRDRRGNVTAAFLCESKRGRPRAGSDSSDAGFFDPDRLPPGIAFDHKKIIRDGIRLLGPDEEGKGGKVLAGGTFNIVHPGHLHFLRKASGLGDRLVVVVANDRTVLRNGKRLLFPARIRADMVGSLDFVDKAVIGDGHDMMKVVRRERPRTIALGYDQDIDSIRGQLRHAGISCRVVRLGKLKGYSTKKITGG